MPLSLTWEQIGLRLALACIASLAIGYNRDEYGRPAGLRTVMLVTLTATLAMLQVNVLLPLTGKAPNSFNVLDLMRLPLGILSGIGFIGAGAIIKKENGATGVTTAATLWFSTMLGLLLGGGQLVLGAVAAVLALLILEVFKHVERYVPRFHRGTLSLTFAEAAPSEKELRERIQAHSCNIQTWSVRYAPAAHLTALTCEIQWKADIHDVPDTPKCLAEIRTLPGVMELVWEQ